MADNFENSGKEPDGSVASNSQPGSISNDTFESGTPASPVDSRRQPPGLYLLFVVEMWERFSYYGMRALLVLYLIRSMAEPEASGNPGRGWPEGQANLLYGWYTGLAYLLPVIGGLLADRFLGTHRSMVIGGVLIALGHVVLAISGIGSLGHNELGMSLFIAGLALIVIGTGYFKPCVSVMVGQLYGPSDPRRDGAFTIFYMGINLGAFICAFICGTLGEQVGWHWGFGAAAIGMVAGLCAYLWGRKHYLLGIGDPPANVSPGVAPLLLCVSFLLAGLVMAAYHFGAFGGFAAAVGQVMSNPIAAVAIPSGLALALVGWAAWFVAIQQPGERGPTASIFIFMLFNAFFWIAFEQAGSTLNVFAERSTDRSFLPWDWLPEFLQVIPATWFQSVNPLCILLFAPIFAGIWTALGRRNLNPTQPVKIGLGLLLLGAGYVFMVFAAMLSAGGIMVSMFWLLGMYVLHTLGELCLSPTGLSYVTKTAPARYVSLLMGIWFISSFLANLGGGIIASYVDKIENREIALPWYPWFELGGRADYFFMFVVSSVGAGLLILLLTPLLKRLLSVQE